MAKSKQEQSQEIVEELQVAHLRKQLARLKKLPRDFRDMEVMSNDWRAFVEIMGPEKKAEMLKWAKGGVLCLAPPNELERKVLNVFGELHEVDGVCSLEVALSITRRGDISFIYASEWPKQVITATNWLATHYEWNFRFKGQLLGGDGLPLGI